MVSTPLPFYSLALTSDFRFFCTPHRPFLEAPSPLWPSSGAATFPEIAAGSRFLLIQCIEHHKSCVKIDDVFWYKMVQVRQSVNTLCKFTFSDLLLIYNLIDEPHMHIQGGRPWNEWDDRKMIHQKIHPKSQCFNIYNDTPIVALSETSLSPTSMVYPCVSDVFFG